jgi:hypothetical protein
MGDALGTLTAAQRSRIAKAASNLTASQTAKFKSMSQGEQFKTLAECGYAKNIDIIASSANIDASLNAQVKIVYKGVDANNNPTEAKGSNAAVVFNALMGNTGPGAVVVGGCDYHGQGSDTAGNKDKECGETLGKIIQLAHLLGKSVVVAGITDGGISFKRGTREPIGDGGSRSLAFLACYKPSGPPTLVKSQIGFYTDGQAAARTKFFSTNPSMVAYVLTLNYLKLCGRMDLVNSVITQGTMSSADMNYSLAFG